MSNEASYAIRDTLMYAVEDEQARLEALDTRKASEVYRAAEDSLRHIMVALIEATKPKDAPTERDLRSALRQAQQALHRACLEIGSTEGYRADFDAINRALNAPASGGTQGPGESGL